MIRIIADEPAVEPFSKNSEHPFPEKIVHIFPKQSAVI